MKTITSKSIQIMPEISTINEIYVHHRRFHGPGRALKNTDE